MGHQSGHITFMSFDFTALALDSSHLLSPPQGSAVVQGKKRITASPYAVLSFFQNHYSHRIFNC